MKKLLIVLVIVLTIFIAGIASGEMTDREIMEYMECKAEELGCESLGYVDISHMTQKDFNEWCFGLFPEYSENEARREVYVDLLDEDFLGQWQIWALIAYAPNESKYVTRYIVAFHN